MLDRRVWCLLIGCAAACTSVALGWGFTVDDSLISTRVAHHLWSGVGYRFNPESAVVDCVTPLGWAPLLAPLSAAGPWSGLLAARWLGVLCHGATAVWVGWRWAHSKAAWGWVAGLGASLALCLPWGAWASAGMETPLIALLCALSFRTGLWALLPASLAAALRPELLPWVFTLSVLAPAEHPKWRFAHVGLGLAGAVLVAAVRIAVFGHPAPLAVFAKPSDLAHGVDYAARGVLLCGLPLLLIAARRYAALDELPRRHAIAILAHVGAIVVAGGDWMSLFRLFVPVLPLCTIVAAHLLPTEPRWRAIGKLSLATLLSAWLTVSYVPKVRGVLAARQHLVTHAEDFLRGKVVGALDVGWVGATGAREVVDFAGVTDRDVALLPGGHTSKQLSRDFLIRRRIEVLVLLLNPNIGEEHVRTLGDPASAGSWRSLPFSRQVAWRVAQMHEAESFVPVALLPLKGTQQNYIVLERLTERAASRGN